MLALVIGGSGSGKSEYAEGFALQLERETKLYIATMYPWDEESQTKIERHKRMRAKKKFETLECFYDLKTGVEAVCEPDIHTAFLDCMSNLVANEMYCEQGYVSQYHKSEGIVEYILNGVEALNQKFEHVVIVSNDVFCDGVDYNEEMQLYLKTLAKVNEGIQRKADLVVECVSGIPVIRKGGIQDETSME